MKWTRRGFLKASTAGALGAAVSRTDAFAAVLEGQTVATARQGLGNLFMKDERPLLVVVEGSDPTVMLEAGLQALGGLENLVQGGRSVIVKPNLANDQPYPTTTDPELTFALSRHLKGIGCEKLSVRDSPSAAGPKRDMAFSGNGYFERGKAAGIEVVSVDKQSDESYIACQESRWKVHSQISIDQAMREADVIINLPTLKRHFIPGMTCALKNHFGSVHGSMRADAHKQARNGEEGVLYFKRSIAEYADAIRCELTIVDARSLMIKGGPSLGGGPAEVKPGVNRMILGGDMVAVEAYGAQLMKENDDTFSAAMADETLEHAQFLGLGVADLGRVEVVEITA